MELSAKHASGDAPSMEASREFSPTPCSLPPCSDESVLQKTRMSHFWDTHHMAVHPSMKGAQWFSIMSGSLSPQRLRQEKVTGIPSFRCSQCQNFKLRPAPGRC